MKTLEYTDLDGSLGWQVVPKIGFEQSKEATPCGTFVRQNGIAPRWIIKSTSNNKKGICVRVHLKWKFRSNVQILSNNINGPIFLSESGYD